MTRYEVYLMVEAEVARIQAKEAAGEKLTRAEELAKNWNAIGIRNCDALYNVGDVMECSHDWDFANDCPSDEFLPGSSALCVSDTWEDDDREMEDYGNEHLYIVVGDRIKYGDDEQEIVVGNENLKTWDIDGALVLKVIR